MQPHLFCHSAAGLQRGNIGNMRILILHNEYQHRGGEDTVVSAETALLRSRGHQVQQYTRHNDEIAALGPARAAMQTVWSGRTSRDLGALIESFKPDLVHAHNTFPLISPSAYWTAAKAQVPLVQTLHNFRLLCPQAMFLRDGRAGNGYGERCCPRRQSSIHDGLLQGTLRSPSVPVANPTPSRLISAPGSERGAW